MNILFWPLFTLNNNNSLKKQQHKNISVALLLSTSCMNLSSSVLLYYVVVESIIRLSEHFKTATKRGNNYEMRVELSCLQLFWQKLFFFRLLPASLYSYFKIFSLYLHILYDCCCCCCCLLFKNHFSILYFFCFSMNQKTIKRPFEMVMLD